ncbi:MAG: ankyrin repeat domain-containing protein [Candidatus Tisiphia sp.]|nr:ankyrin repeat domain-containing protein [Candidatus Tisiphia sp.]
MLVKKGADVNTKWYAKPILHYAAKESNWGIVKWLVEHGADVNVRNKNGETVLHCAVKSCQVEIVKLLLGKGADVNAIDSSSDFTELVKKLMADTDSDGNTVLHCAAKTSQWYTVQWLVKQGADINVEDNVGRTVLNYAVLNIVMYGLTR